MIVLNVGVQGEGDSHVGYLARVLDALLFRVIPDDNLSWGGYIDFGHEITLNQTNE